MTRGYFITGTDTDSGKTLITLGLMRRLKAQGHRVVAMKPVAAGAGQTAEGLRNGDALQLQAEASCPIDYALLNPYLFEPPIAPHLAATQAGVRIDFSWIRNCFERLSDGADRVLVEGAGGWQVPLDEDKTLADLARFLGLPVILVVGLRLGCINHALLSAESIRASGVNLAGWIGNQTDPAMWEREANIETLAQWLEVPCLGQVPWLEKPSPQGISDFLQLPDDF